MRPAGTTVAMIVGAALAAAGVSAQTLDTKIRDAAAPAGVTWVGYRVPSNGLRHRMCDSDRMTKVILEAPTEVVVLARIEQGVLTRLRTVTPDCEIDSTGAALVWLPDVAQADSVAWLTSLLSHASSDRTADQIANEALAALSMHGDATATPALIDAARSHPSPKIRGRALFWLAQRAGDRAVAAITNAIADDPETEVKKRAVFALSQLPNGTGIPQLIDVARTNRNPDVRRQAFFWLGQSKDPRAVRFFEDVLLKK